MIKWDKVFETERRQFEKMSETEKFIYFLLLQYKSPYGWGKENPETSDCSGAVCMALFAATGLLVRTTADDLFRRAFTVRNPASNMIRAAFFLTEKDKKHGDRFVKAGTVTHIAGLVDEGVILNSQEPFARVRPLRDVAAAFEKEGSVMIVRGLEKKALVGLAAEGKAVYGLDDEWSDYFSSSRIEGD